MRFKSIILVIFCCLFTLNIQIKANEIRSTEKVKARYSFKKGKKNEEALSKLAHGF